jgi:hypothetical protein
MALNTFDIRNLVTSYIGLPYPEFVAKKIVNTNISVSDIGTSGIKNDLGLPFFMDFYCTLPNLGKVRLPNEPLIRFHSRKNIVKTVTVGSKRKGTVKEFISADDYQIELRGICIDPKQPQRYPSEQVEIIRELAETRQAINIENSILELFQIHQIVVESASYSDMQGIPGAQAYTIRAISNEDFLAERKVSNNQKFPS